MKTERQHKIPKECLEMLEEVRVLDEVYHLGKRRKFLPSDSVKQHFITDF